MCLTHTYLITALFPRSIPLRGTNLSERQKEVLYWVRKGYLINEIAQKLNIGESWVLVHVARIINKGIHVDLMPYQIVRYYKMGLSHKTIAEKCGISKRRSEQTISRLINTLRLKPRPHWRHLKKKQAHLNNVATFHQK